MAIVAIVFRSKIDAKYKALAFSMAAVAFLATWLRPRVAAPAFWAAMDLLMIGAAVLVIWMTFATYYEIGHDSLVAHSGPFSWRIPLAEIVAVRPSANAHSGPAMSMDRLEISYGGERSILISPAEQSEFLAILHRQVPRLAAAPRGTT